MDARAFITLRWPVFFSLLCLAMLPIAAIAVGFGVNVYYQQVDACFPIFEGCVSISRAVRGSDGLPWFRLLILPCCVLLPLNFIALSQTYFPLARAMRWSSYIAALFLFLYVCFLGSDGAFYQWLRRIGIVFFFAGTGLAQLWWAQQLSHRFTFAARKALRTMHYLSALLLLLALLHITIKHGFPAIEKIENMTEWWLALLLCVGFMQMAIWWRQEQQTDGVTPSVFEAH